MSERFTRTEMLFGQCAIEQLSKCRVAVFGIGGVGGYTVEALARCGVGAIDLIDSDTVCLSNLNRQIIATESTVGKYKVDAARERILDINPRTAVTVHKTFLTPQNAAQFDFGVYDYVVDAIDTVSAKIALAVHCAEMNTPLISSMGTGNKVDPTAFEIADIYKTSVDPLARVMRRELKKRGIKKLKVVYSKEEPLEIRDTGGSGQDDISLPLTDTCIQGADSGERTAVPSKRRTPGSTSFVPSVAGLIIAGEVIKDLIGFGRS